MNYYDARQRQTDKRWDYTCQNDGRIWPVGYCAGYHEPVDDGIVQWREEDRQRIIAAKEKYHRDGHATKDEAHGCYKRYCLDQHLYLDGQWQDTQHKCKVCGAWTDKFAEVNHQHFDLCDEHRNRENVEKLFDVGYTMSSY